MTIEKSLKLVTAQKPQAENPVVQRRTKLQKAIHRQVILLKNYQKGEKTNRPWFWVNEDGTIYLQIKYGKMPLELSKGKFTIECSSLEDIETNLDKVEALVCIGEFDSHLAEASKNIRTKFKKA